MRTLATRYLLRYYTRVGGHAPLYMIRVGRWMFYFEVGARGDLYGRIGGRSWILRFLITKDPL